MDTRISSGYYYCHLSYLFILKSTLANVANLNTNMHSPHTIARRTTMHRRREELHDDELIHCLENECRCIRYTSKWRGIHCVVIRAHERRQLWANLKECRCYSFGLNYVRKSPKHQTHTQTDTNVSSIPKHST
jgi:hypothetical protein